MDLSKAFDCIPYDLLIAKLEAYGFSEDFLIFLYLYLKRRKQSVKRTILGPLLFNIFINGVFCFIKDAQLLNFAHDNTIATFSDSFDYLIADLQKESENAIDWFRLN